MRKSCIAILLVSIGCFAVAHRAEAQSPGQASKAKKPERAQKVRQIPRVSGVVHLEGLGDHPLVDHQWAGTKGQSRRLEGFSLNLNTPESYLRLEYMCHLQDQGDIGWMTEGSFCGTRGQSRRLEGFAIRLAGPAAGNFSIHYRCHLQDIGDSAVMSDGEFCGTRGQSRRLEAIQVWLTRK